MHSIPHFFCSFNRKIEKAVHRSAPLLHICVDVAGSAVLAHLGEAVAAIHRTIGLGLEGNLCLAAACSTGCCEELTGATSSVLASVAASLAALGLILEAALCVEFLLAGSENEFLTTLFAN